MINKTPLAAFVFAGLLLVGCSSEQNAGTEASPYAGQENREIAALSAEEVNGYLEGRGMGLAKVAELNRYPGPKHVLDLSQELGLSERQRQQIVEASEKMKSRAQDLGRQLTEKERRLDRLFASESASKREVEVLLQEIGEAKAQLRFAHVQAHMEVKQVLTPEQVSRYDELRGYGEASGGSHKHQHHGHGA